MNTATQNLEHDHEYIIQLTEVMQSMAGREDVKTEHYELVTELIRKFADGLHHAKEEDLLFPKMGEKGFSAETGPVAVMLSEHVQGRNYVKGMLEGIDALQKGDQNAKTLINQNMIGYAELLQHHIHKENNILFRMADMAFSDEEQIELLEKFASVENAADYEFTLESVIRKVDLLSRLYN